MWKALSCVFLIFLMLIPWILVSQEQSMPQHSLEINFSGNSSFRMLSSENSNLQNTIDSRNNSEKAAFGYHVGLGYNHRLSANLVFNTGLQLERHSFTSFGNITGIDGTPAGVFEIDLSNRQVVLPIRLKHFFYGDKLKLFVGAGINFLYFLSEKNDLKITYNDGRVENIANSGFLTQINKINIGPGLSLGLSFKINQLVDMSIESIGRYNFISITDNSIKENHHSFGTQLALQFKI